MLVRNPCTHDARVLREAKTLARQGFDVTIIAVNPRRDLPEREQRDGFQIIRVEVNPLSVRLLRRLTAVLSVAKGGRRVYRRLRLLLRLGYRGLRRLRSRAYRALRKASRGIRALAALVVRLIVRLLGGSPEAGQPIGEQTRLLRVAERLSEVISAALHGLAMPFLFGGHLLGTIGDALAGPLLAALRWGRRLVSRLLRALERRFLSLARNVVMLFHDPLALLDYGLRCRQIVAKQPAHIYHAHDFNTLPVGYYLSRRYKGKLVYDSHELNLEAGRMAKVKGLQKWLLRAQERFLIRRCDAVITVNQSIAAVLARQYAIRPPMVVMNCPERVEFAGNESLRTLADIDGDYRIVLYHGNLAANRGLHQLVEASQWFDRAVLVFMGAGALRAELAALASELGVAQRVSFIDPVPVDQVIGVVSTADLGVIPVERTVKSYYYALPNKFFDCLMAGVPVATSNFPEMEAIISKHAIGATFDPTNPRDIARAVNLVVTSADFYSMKERAREVARGRYCWEVESTNLVALYSSLAEDMAKASG